MAPPRSQSDWVPCRGYGGPVDFSGAAGGTGAMGAIVLVHPGITDDPLDPLSEAQVAVMETPRHIVVERVIGQVDVIREDFEETNQVVGLRIAKVIWDHDDNAFASFEDSLFTGDDANSQFLWQRYINLQSGSPSLLAGAFGTDPWWSTIDVQVSRMLEREEALVLLFQLQGLAVHQAQITPWLRCYCKTVR